MHEKVYRVKLCQPCGKLNLLFIYIINVRPTIT